MARSFVSASSQSIEVASAPSINFGSGDFTVLAWVRFPAVPNDASMIVGKRAGGFDGDEGWELKFNSGTNETIRWDVETDVTGRQRAEGTATNITDGNWHLIGGDHTDGAPTAQLQIWYDGAVIATKVASTPGTVDTTTPLVIAAAYNTPNTNFLDGEVGPVFACTRILTLAEHQMMAAGFSPRFLRPLPYFLLELISNASPEPDITGGLTGTLQNAPGIVVNPRLVLPRAPDIGQDLWYESIEATIAGQSALATTITRARAGAATIIGQSSIAATISPRVPITAAIAGQSTVTADVSANVAPECTIAGQSAITANVNIDAAVGTVPIRGRGQITASLSANVPVMATIGGQSTLTAAATAVAPVDATIAGQSALTVTGDRLRGLSTTLAGQSTLTAAVTITAGLEAQIAAQSTVAATTSATAPALATLQGQSGVVATLTAGVPAVATIVGASVVTATVTRAQPVQATVAGQSTIVVDTRPIVPVATIIAGQSTLTASPVVIVRPVVTIDGESDILARPTYPGTKKTTSVGGILRWLDSVAGRIRRVL